VRDRRDIVSITLERDEGTVEPLLQTENVEGWPEFSPDGRSLAYGSDVSGRQEVYVRPHPGPGAVQQVSLDGGTAPAWHPNGREIFFIADGGLMAADFAAGSPPHIGRPHLLFAPLPRVLFACVPVRCYDVAPDGRRFYAVQYAAGAPLAPVTHINLIANWFEELKAKVPVGR
jgi:serine/threonine-protein kinase